MEREELFINGLLGLDGEAFIDGVKQNVKKVKQVLKQAKIPRTVMIPYNSRTELLEKLQKVDQKLAQDVIDGIAQFVDCALHVIKPIASLATVEMILDGDSKETGYCMLNQGKLEKNEVMMLDGISLLQVDGVSAAITSATAGDAATVTRVLDQYLRNGEFEFKANGKTLIPWNSMEIFAGIATKEVVGAATYGSYGFAYGNGGGGRLGYFPLQNAKLLESQFKIDFNARWKESGGAYHGLKLILHGTRIFRH